MTLLNESTVKLIDSMGDDLRILAAARVSTGAQASKGEEKDKKLLKYLWEHGHTSPFEQVSFTFLIRCPIFIQRQIVRHRTAKMNEESGRYKELRTDFFTPTTWRKQNTEGNKQGSNGAIYNQTFASIIARDLYQKAEQAYHDLLELGVAKEQARMVLPVGLFTEFYWTMDLHNLLKFLSKRIAPDAQPEVQEIARKIVELIKTVVPWSIEVSGLEK